MPKILILLSSYNGHKFLAEQLDSLFCQEECTLKLLVRDDGSTDSTVDVLHSYQQKYPDKIDIIKGNNIGWKKSFFELIKIAYNQYPNFDYYAFADQDDIWLSDKLSSAIKALILYQNDSALYCSNLFYYKDNINHGPIIKSTPIITEKSCLVRNYATGCTVVFNSKFLLLLNTEFPKIDIAHDYWCFMVAVCCGIIIYDEKPHIFYRQHSNNQIGAKRGKKALWKRRCREFNDIINKHIRERQAEELYRIFKNQMSPISKEAVGKMATYRKSLKSRFALLEDDEYTTGVNSSDRWLKLKIFFGWL